MRFQEVCVCMFLFCACLTHLYVCVSFVIIFLFVPLFIYVYFLLFCLSCDLCLNSCHSVINPVVDTGLLPSTTWTTTASSTTGRALRHAQRMAAARDLLQNDSWTCISEMCMPVRTAPSSTFGLSLLSGVFVKATVWGLLICHKTYFIYMVLVLYFIDHLAFDGTFSKVDPP